MSTSKRDERVPWVRIGREYNEPGEVPREEIWAGIWEEIAAPTQVAGRERLPGSGPVAGPDRDPSPTEQILELDAARRRRTTPVGGSRHLRRLGGLAVAAAAALVLGIGIGRMSVPAPSSTGEPTASPASARSTGLGLAARDHLDRTESLLTMVRADARDGRVDPDVAGWAEDLLAQTRLLLDRPEGVEPEMRELLLDLELILVQVVGVGGADGEEDRTRTEVELTLRSLDQGELLPRIQAALPQTMAGV